MIRRITTLLTLLVAACGTAPAPSAPAPSAALELGIDWGRATSVERPANYQETVPPSFVAAHPILTIPGQAMMTDLIALPAGGFTAIGYAPPDWVPVAWTSADGSTWAFHEIEGTAFTFPVALASGGDGTVVAVGRSGSLPVAWTTTDGRAWAEHPIPVAADGAAERATTVAARPDGSGFIAGGSVGPELAERHVRFWTSRDGVTWEAVPDDPAAFADAEVRSIAAVREGFVAVGVVGTAQVPTDAVAWVSGDGLAWERIEDPAFDGGSAVSVIPAPFGGVLAVGSDVGRREAVAWTSIDGRTWKRAPTEDSRLHPNGYAWMTDVVAIGQLMVGVGMIQGLQRATAMAWVSTDGLTWRRANRAPVQEQGELYAVAAGGPGIIAIGSYGGPDSYVPQVWLSPAR